MFQVPFAILKKTWPGLVDELSEGRDLGKLGLRHLKNLVLQDFIEHVLQDKRDKAAQRSVASLLCECNVLLNQ